MAHNLRHKGIRSEIVINVFNFRGFATHVFITFQTNVSPSSPTSRQAGSRVQNGPTTQLCCTSLQRIRKIDSTSCAYYRITGGDSGIGRAVAVLFAREGADIAIVYLHAEESDAQETQLAVEAEGRVACLIPGDVTDPRFCKRVIETTVERFGQLDILVNNAAYQQTHARLEDILGRRMGFNISKVLCQQKTETMFESIGQKT